MLFGNTPIRRTVMTVTLITSGSVLLLTCAALVAYDFLTFRASTIRNVSMLGKIIAANSTAALAFDNKSDAIETLAALKAEPHIVAAILYDADDIAFSRYPADLPDEELLPALPADGYRFEHSSLIGLQPVEQGKKRWGTLYLKSDMSAMYERLWLYSGIALLVTAVAFCVAYLLSRVLQRQISQPIMMLADTARAISERRDYSVRAAKMGANELGLLTDAFNHMLTQIQQEEKTKAQLAAIVQSSEDAIISKTLDGTINSWNPGATKLFGYAADECIGTPMLMLFPEERADKEAPLLQRRVTLGEGAERFEAAWPAKDGRRLDVSVRISPIRDDQGAVIGASTIARDITERKQAETKLQAQFSRLDLLHQITRAIGERQDLRSIFQVVIRSLEDSLSIDFGCICLYEPHEAMLIVNTVGVRSINLAMELAMTEQARIPIDQNGLSHCVRGQLVYEPDISEVRFPFPSRLARGGLQSLVVAPLRAEGKVFGVLVAARRQAHSFSSNACEFLRQLSEHVGLAAHQAQLYGTLQQAYDDLRLSQQTVLQQERLRALGEMASGVAHDINNAISPVALYTESLLEREPGLSARARGYLTTIQRAIDDVAQTVSRMREFYRPREPQLTLARIDLNAIIPQVIDLTRVRWRDLPQERGAVIDLQTQFEPNLSTIQGAESEIRDALTNLIFNAVDAMPEGGRLIVRTRCSSVSSASGVDADTRVLLEVIDSGIGMSEETRQRCLEPFFTTKGERGTGLGLGMVYGMAQRHSAELEIESTLGKGTTMRLIFLAAEVGADETSRQLTPQFVEPLRILIVDDDPLIIESLSEALRGDGHQVTAADGGQAGIDIFKTAHMNDESFQLVITDLGMPYVDGRRVAAAVKGTSPATPVVLLTGWGQRLIAENEVPAYVDRVLNKPPKLRELRAALAELATAI